MIPDLESKRIINLSCRFNNHNFYFDCFSGDFQTKVLSRGEVWERHIASFMLNINTSLVFFDIGANIGFSIVYFWKNYLRKKTLLLRWSRTQIFYMY